jgi:hypothetical protein
VDEGLAALATHRLNYEGDNGIHRLQLLWWEFPPEQEQVDIAAKFIDELWVIGVFELIPEDCEMRANCPLFAVAKPGQPGEWRIIADMKNGGQNAHIGKDPVHLPRAWGILEQLYAGVGLPSLTPVNSFIIFQHSLKIIRIWDAYIHERVNDFGIWAFLWDPVNLRR